ncbi:cytochrome c oxidase assembly protein [Halomonas sp. HP20-15]|uniref:cytochrome c oxidase assembly protein n=1 Tax=Halomonas sp. HP20-15 TaxID=3085901 RepID=UPI002981E1E5|nr:cytochrome c oxidase assembly protein [Halomonas sp. HP20-15]MDW5375825.1 cytochrome c oxidase assembly protein [Halomonas sp. HP20-15]
MPSVAQWLALTAGLLYLVGAWRSTRTGKSWSPWRSASFTAGIVTLVVAFAPPLNAFAHHDLRGHMLQHLLVGMFAPLGLVFGAPMGLLLRNLSPARARGIVRLLGSVPVRVLSHPLSAAVLDIGGMYLLYLTPLYALSMTTPWLHHLIHLHFVISGCLFSWAIAGPDPAPHRPRWRTRLGVLFLAIATHATLGKLIYAWRMPQGTGAGVDEIQAAAQWMYYGGDLAEIVLLMALMQQWLRRRRAAERSPLADPA